jgi:copper chaperone CopZ
MKNIFILLAIAFCQQADAQVKNASLQASGLTCSMCSNAIHKSLETLDFVEKVFSNIKTSTFEITFKPGAAVNFDLLKKKVQDAGFSVANLITIVNFKGDQVKNDTHLVIDGKTFHFLNVKEQVLTGDQKLQIIDKGFVTDKNFKKNSSLTKMACYKTGVAESCCTKSGLTKGSRIYHVTI